MPTKKKFYAVASGRQLGIYMSWSECEAQVKGFKGAKFKSFGSNVEAEHFLEANKLSSAKDHASLPEEPSANKRRKIEPTRKIRIEILFDGGSRGNPGLSGSGSEVLVTEQTMTGEILKQQRIHIRKYLGNATNNEAEYNGVLTAVQKAKSVISVIPKEMHTWVADIQVKGDSNLIIQQLNGLNECRSANLLPLYRQVKSTLSEIRAIMPLQVSFEHIYRKENSVADGKYACGCANHLCFESPFSVLLTKAPLLFTSPGLANEAMNSKRSYITVIDESGEQRPQDV
jgi:ribonuclease HI